MRYLPILILLALAGVVQSDAPLLLRNPAVSKTQIVFQYAGGLWSVDRNGGSAHRLTVGLGSQQSPEFSPDGNWIAFTANYAGNADVYIIPAAGGQPRRLTFHPAEDIVLGWTPDGKSVLFRSYRSSYYRFAGQLFTVPVDGGNPQKVPLPIAETASYSPDGTHIAYVPHAQWQPAWKHYRGGQTTPIWIADLKDSSITKIPRENSNDFNPMWVGNNVYFLSDRNGAVSLFAYDVTSGKVREVIKNQGLDFKSASASADSVVYEQFGSLHIYDPGSGKSSDVNVVVAADLPEVRPQFAPVDPKNIHSYGISPTGTRALMGVYGEIFTIPSGKGDIRNLTNTSAIAERDPSWSPDGKWIAYFSDASGEYQLQLQNQAGNAEKKFLNPGDAPSFYYKPQWSPDSKKILYTDKRLNLWYMDIQAAKNTRIDTDLYDHPVRALNPVWSPDSKWIAYTRQLPSHLRAVFLYSLASGKAIQVTDGLSDAQFPAFDPNGKYLYFTASTDVGLTSSWLDMSSLDHPITRSVYVAVLGKKETSPIAPESDEEKIVEQQEEKEKTEEKKEVKKPVIVTVDEEGIGQRILALPIPARNYVGLQTGKTGVLFLAEGTEVIGESESYDARTTLQKFDLSTRKTDKFLDDVSDFVISADGAKMLYRKGGDFAITKTEEPPAGQPKPGEGPLNLAEMQVHMEPRAMWKQIYHEAWRIQRDFLYDPNHQGLDLNKVEAKYAPYLERLGSRDELTYLFEEALGEIQVGHVFVGGGYKPEVKPVKTGLLGADYSIENGRYRIARVYDGENWNPDLQAPLTQPGVNVHAGEYILAVNGRELHASDEIYSFFEGTAGKQIVLKVGGDPGGKNAREVTVVPIDNELGLRRRAWIEGNRRKVAELTGGKVAYVYLPDTAGGGFTNFNRYFYAQVGKEGVILDERFNEGGLLADYIIDQLRRPVLSFVTAREGADFTSPGGSIYGPKVMIINEQAGSGGDAMPWYFRKAAIGPLVGKNTWGGLVGIYDYPELLDGGYVTAPRAAIYGLNGEWEVEGRGVAPDIVVELDPAAARTGHDAQLEKAVEVILDLMKKNPLPAYKKPLYPDLHKTDELGIVKH